MGRFLVKRLLLSIVVIFGLSILIFILARIIPGDPARLALGERATEEAVAEQRELMRLNDPLPSQYIYWLSSTAKGNLGMSFYTQRDVARDIKQFLPATVELVVIGGVFQLIFSFALGITATRYRDTLIDGIIRTLTYISISIPPFVWAILFLLVFGHLLPILPVINRLTTGVAPPLQSVTGMYTIDFLIEGNLAGAWDAFRHCILPSFALAIGHFAQEARILRSSMIDNLNKEYITVATSYGIPQNLIMRKYLLKPSSIAMITIAGLDFAATIANAFLVETVFNWPGLSRYGLVALLAKDLNAISAVILLVGLTYLVVNIIVDIIIAALDPRVRLGE